MKAAIKLALAAAFATGISAQPHQHDHRLRHAKMHMQEMEKRDVATVTSVVIGPTVLAYVLDGAEIEPSAALQGIEDGLYVVMGTSTPTSTSVAPTTTSTTTTPTPTPTSTSTTSTSTSTSTSSIISSSSVAVVAEFLQIQSSTSTSATPTPTPSAAASPPATGGATGINADFPSGQIPCSAGVPTQYGAIEVDWVGLGGWASLQQVGSWTPGVSFDNIVEPVKGPCAPGMFCSFACPNGYLKTQFPATSQGSQGQSVGGVWCNSDGMLELSQTSYSTLCMPGPGGVYVKNELSGSAAVCRTDYPGSEAMVLPTDTQPGGTYPLANVDETSYYIWEGKQTSLQYYVNPLNVAVEDACVWTSPTNPTCAGNWSPTNIGVGMDASGTTYISIFANLPTSSCTLDFDITITGDVASECYLKGGVYAGGSGSTGCTTAVSNGGTATIVFSNSS